MTLTPICISPPLYVFLRFLARIRNHPELAFGDDAELRQQQIPGLTKSGRVSAVAVAPRNLQKQVRGGFVWKGENT